jgi:hypothetical protein
MRRTLPLVALLAACAPSVTLTPNGQPTGAPPAAQARGVASITAADVRRRIFLIADDSMMGRGTPSKGLESMAAYAVSEFRRLGLKPAGEHGTFVQRYPLQISRFDPAKSWVRTTGKATANWTLGADAPLFTGEPSGDVTDAGIVLVVGDSTVGVTIPEGTVTGKVIVVLMGPAVDGIAGMLLQQRPAGVILVAPLPDQQWAMMPGRTPSTRVVNPSANSQSIPPVIAMRRPSFEGWLAQAGAAAGVLDTKGAVRAIPLPGTTMSFHIDQQTVGADSAPNVIGVVEGSDPALKGEYVIYSAHMDHIGTPGSGQGCSAIGADSICNGADDDGSGTVALLELAEAWATSAVKPKRSMAFILVSGEERGLWGSGYWADHPTLPIGAVVADLNIDMVGRNAPDTVAVIGREHSDLSATLDRVAAAHPELGLNPIGDPWPQEGLYFRSDHFNFARKGVPILFFTTGIHPDYHAATDSPDRLDADKDARIATLLYHLGETIANTATRPQWDAASRERIVEKAPTP